MALKKDILVYGTASVRAKGQIVIPAKLRKELNVQEGDTLVFIGSAFPEAFNVVKAETAEELTKALNRLLKAKRALNQLAEEDQAQK